MARIDELTGVWTLPAQQYPNGDRAQYLDLCFLRPYCRRRGAGQRRRVARRRLVRARRPAADDGAVARAARPRPRLHAAATWFDGGC